MRTTNSWIDKLAVARVDFDTRGMLNIPAVSLDSANEDDNDKGAVEGYIYNSWGTKKESFQYAPAHWYPRDSYAPVPLCPPRYFRRM